MPADTPLLKLAATDEKDMAESPWTAGHTAEADEPYRGGA